MNSLTWAGLQRYRPAPARSLRDFAESEDRLRLVIDTIPPTPGAARPDGSVDFVNQRVLEFTGSFEGGSTGLGTGVL